MASIGLRDCMTVAFKAACITASRLVAVPGGVAGYVGGRTVGAVGGAVIVGGAKLSNKLFNTDYKPRSINEYSISAAGSAANWGALTSSIMIPAYTAPLLGVPIILGKVFEFEYTISVMMENYDKEADKENLLQISPDSFNKLEPSTMESNPG
ncbi:MULTISPECIES: hypothetical protein [unclassified Endozoicomonas]|uniref:hypothetical protein n=1 Tax=unclassified Endozoicomonas TaxID=2644528 RepID=UPI002148B8E1|nr:MULTISPECIES: hypothetical protein [unclassified Endozoicomonas]